MTDKRFLAICGMVGWYWLIVLTVLWIVHVIVSALMGWIFRGEAV